MAHGSTHVVILEQLTTSAASDDSNQPFHLEEAGNINIRGWESHDRTGS